MNPLEAFPGGADKARAFIESARLFVMGPTDGTETTMSKQMHAVFNLALLGLDSLAADPEREAKALASIRSDIDECSYGMSSEPNGDWIYVSAVMDILGHHRALLRPAPPSPSVAALREAARELLAHIAFWPKGNSHLQADSYYTLRPVDVDRLRAALAASNANARGGE